MCYLLLKRPCKKKLSTRIILVKANGPVDCSSLVGFMVEKATEMVSIDENLFKTSAMKNPDIPIEGSVAIHDGFVHTKIIAEDIFEKLDKKFFQNITFSAMSS